MSRKFSTVRREIKRDNRARFTTLHIQDFVYPRNSSCTLRVAIISQLGRNDSRSPFIGSLLARDYNAVRTSVRRGPRGCRHLFEISFFRTYHFCNLFFVGDERWETEERRNEGQVSLSRTPERVYPRLRGKFKTAHHIVHNNSYSDISITSSREKREKEKGRERERETERANEEENVISLKFLYLLRAERYYVASMMLDVFYVSQCSI